MGERVKFVTPSSLEKGNKVSDGNGGVSYEVLEDCAKQQNGDFACKVQYIDGGISKRTWETDKATIPVIVS